MEAKSAAPADVLITRDMATMVGILLLCLLAACSGGSATRRPGPLVGAPNVSSAPAAVCPGVDAGSLRALYVSPQGSDTGLCSADAPCKTIAYALSWAHYLGYPAIVLQHGLYQTTETIDLKDGVSLYGSCLFDNEPDRKYRTVIQASPAPGTPAISANGVKVTVSGLVVIGKDETASGAGVAMTAGNASVTLGRTVLVSGTGGHGATPPPVQSPAAVRSTGDHCYTPGGAAGDSLWGQVDLGTFAWVPGIGGAGAGGAYDTGPGGVGGQQGGASIGLLLVNSTMATVPDQFNRIISSVGGAGQAGPSFGCGGGANSGGAGGNGGPSIGVASINAAGVPNGGFVNGSLY